MNYNPHDINWSEQSVQSKQFWENQLAQEQGERIFFDLHPHSEQYASKTMELNISAELTHEINRISGDKELFAYIIFLTILQIQMYRYTGKAVSVNVPVFQDGISEERSTINRILPLNIHLNDQLSVKQTIGLCRQEVMAVLKHQYYPLNELNPSSYQFVIGMANLHTDLESASCTNEQIQIWIEKQHEGFCFRITYNHNYYKEEGIQAFWSRYLYVLENSIANTDQQIDHVALLSSQETANIMQWSAGEKSIYPKYSTIAELFENIVQSVRTETAIFAGKEICHYEALNRQANILAHFLRSCGVGNGDIIPVICDKNTDTIASMLAVIKSGAAYLPIDKDYPEARIQYLIENSQAKRIIDAAGVSDRFGDWKHTLDMLCPNDQKLDVTQIQNPEIINSPEDTAYLIYTSGTTGKPKGVCITHRSLAKMVLNNGYMKIQAGDQMLQAGSLSFDASVQQIWLALLHGIPLHMVAKNVLLDSEQLGVYINRQQITHLILPTSLFNQMDSSAFQCVKYLIAGGEVISSKQVHRCLEAYPELHIINGYGPTENTVISTAFPMTNRWDEKEAIPIGKPVSNSSAYIMDKNMQLLPAGVPGELVVGGDGVARGYWNHEQLTADKFKNNQYIPGERLYRTGDLARWRADGNLEFLGRIDEQVKIRGYRVELGEIEQTLTAYRQVKEAVVIAQKGQSAVTQLYAYIIGFTEDSIDLNAVNAYLRNELPEYMIPSALMQLENIPLTPNGKTDRKALPEPDLSAKTSVYCAPKNELEQMLVTVWEEVLGIEPVGIYDSFLDIGGDSIRSIQIASRLRSRQIHVGVQEIMQYKTIAEIALHVKEAHISLPQNEVEGIVEKTPIIRYFLEFTQPSAFRHFNQSVMLYHPNHFEDRIVKSVMESLIKHHDGLRMILVNSGDEQSLPVFDTEVQLEIRAFNDSALFYNFQSFDWVTQIDAEQQITQKAEKMQLAMNISKGPLIQVGVFHTAAGDHLLISMHHLIVDSVSWQIFLEDFYAAYKAATKKEQYIFPEKTTSFQNWAASQKEYARNHQLLKELDYWQKVVEKQTTIKPIKNHTLLKNMISQTITLNDEATEKLLKKANRAYGTTINDLLLAALGYAVQQFNGQEHVSLMLEGHGREPLKGETGKGIDITRTIGWFTSIYPVNLQITDSDLGMLVKRTKEVLHRVPNKGIGYGILKHLAELDLTNNNLLSTGTDISFNYLGQLDNSYRNDQEMIMSPLGTGVQASPDLHVRENLQINGFVKDQKLQMIMEFNEEQWTEADRNQLASLYEYALYRVIDHCTAIQYTEKTPVDYGIHDLSLEEVMEFKKYIIEQVSTEATIEHINRLTPMQQGMFFTLSEQKDTQAYIVQGEYSLKGRVQPFIFQKALDILCQQHQVLNSIFVEHEKHPVQIVLSNWKKEVSVIDIQDMAYPEEACIAYKQSLLQQGFDIQKDPLFHLSLVQTQPEEFRLIITCHHLILDGWSHGRMLKDLLDIYRRVEKGSINTVIPEYDFASYIEWLEDQEEDQALIYWQNQLEDYSQDIILPIDKNTTTEYAEGIHEVILLADQSDYLKRAAQNNAITLNTLCQTAWGILLQRYSNTNDVIFGAVVSGRPPEMDNIEQMMGMFINTLPIRITSRSEQTVIELLQEVQINNQNKSPYEYVSLAKIQNTTSLKYHRLNTLMVLENYPDISYENQDELNFTIERIHGREQTAYDLNIIFTSKNDWKFTLMYNRNLFTEEIIRQLGDHLQYILQLLVEYPNRQTEQITLMDTETCLELIHKFNPVHTTPSIERTLAEVLEEEAGRRSYQPAVISGGKQLTYGELNRRANQLAHCLRQQGVQPDEPVPVLCSKSIDTIVAMVGIIKAGGAYVPIDESYPAARISYLLTDSQARWIVGSPDESARLGLDHLPLCWLDLSSEQIDRSPNHNPEPVNRPTDLAYIIYTSGTTGHPKGVCVEQRSVIKNAKYPSYMQIGDTDRMLQAGSLSFDAAVLPIWSALLHGIPLHLEPDELVHAFHELSAYIRESGITLAVLPTTLFNQLSREYPETFAGMRYVVAGGDVISASQVSRLVAAYPALHIVNGYGPTENTVISTAYTIQGSWEEDRTVPIGRPVSHSTAYVMNDQLQLLPAGIAGELVVGGAGVARGYWKREQLTAEQFVANPYVEGERLYRTGDLVRWQADGQLYFLGRIDQQVKIRGHRIEVSEIEKRLEAQTGVREAVVAVRKEPEGEAVLYGYVVREPGTSTELATIEQALRQELPGYMIPARLIELESMPLTPNGKIDKKALPEPALDIHSPAIVLPRSQTEEIIMQLWTDILNVPIQSVQASFFDLGGHSIKAITLISRLYQAFHIQVPVTVIFNEPTIEKLALYVDAHKHEKTEGQQLQTIPRIEEKEFYETSGVQKRMFALYQNDPYSIHYNMPGVYRVHGHLDAEQLKSAFKDLIERHESLRTCFLVAEQGSVQKINSSVPFLMPVITVNNSLAQSHNEIASIIKDWIQPFDLTQAPLIRGGLIQLKDADILFLDIHHIISDAVSMGILLDDLRSLYKGEALPALSLQYKDFAEWQYAQLDGQAMKEHEAYWLEALAGELPVLSLPEDTKRFDMKQVVGENITLTLDRELKQKIDGYIRPISVTPYMFYLAVFNILLSKHSGQTDIIVGSPAAARIQPGLDNIVGMFVNTLPMRNSPDHSKPFHDFLQEVRGNALKAFEHQEYDLIQLIEKLDIKKEKNRNWMLDVLFSVESLESSEIALGDQVLSRYDIHYDLCKFDVSLDVFQDEKGKEDTVFNFNYNSGLFHARTMERFTNHYVNLLQQIVDNPDVLLKDLSLMSQTEKEELRLFNSVKTAENHYATWQAWFEEQVTLTPDNIAVSDANKHLSYKQLNQQANQLAHVLCMEDVQPGTIVAVIADRSVYTVVGMLAVIKAGGTYMPVDPDYPEERIMYMLEDSQSDIILVKQSEAERYSQFVSRCIACDSITEHPQWNVNPAVVCSTEDLMYIIYTSGTTGKPKAVMVEHRNVINIAEGWIKDYRLREMEVTLLQLASFSFDVSIGDMCRSLLSGGRLIICPAETRTDPAALYQLIQSNQVTLFESTPGLIIPLMNYIYENQLPLEHLKLLILGSDICTAADFNTLYHRYGEQMRIINSYGITETTIDSSFFELHAGEKVESIHVPIGKPMQNSYFYILDQGYNELPVGISGELYIGGAGVSRGYMNRQELTGEKFVANPFVPGTLMYKTGDLARWLPEGNVELMGRIDQQVKVRGYRIELGEIESLLLSHPRISEAAAVLNASNQDLVCFVTVTSLLETTEIRSYLEELLPSYMIPSAVVILPELPLTSNGKLDRRVLSEVPVSINATGYVAPRDEVEILMSGLWSDVLEKSKIGIDDPFFELGGHSLKAITLIFKIAGVFNAPVSVTDLFHHFTIRKLCALIKEKRKLESESSLSGKWLEPIQQAEKAEFYPCSAVQRRLYTIYAQNPDSKAYNMPDIFVVKGKLDHNRLQSAFDVLIQRHQSLRTSFHHINGEIVQHIQQQTSFQCPFIQLETLQYSSIQQIVDEFVRPFQLDQSPLISAQIVEWNNICLLMMDTHHIVGDGISTARLLEELSVLYTNCDQQLPSLDLNYTDFAVWQNSQLAQGNFENDEKYWTQMLNGVLPQLQMPADFKRTPEVNTEGALLRFDIPVDLSGKVNTSLLYYGITPYMFYLAAFQILLSRYSGQQDIITASPMVGRPDERLYRTVGMFLNTVPMRNQVGAHKTIRAFLNEVKENVLAAGEHQHYDLENLLSRVDAPYEAGRNRIFDTMFTLQNTEGDSFSLGDAVLTGYLHESRTAKFDISLFMMADSSNQVSAGVIEYKSSLYTPYTAERWKEHLLKIVEQMIAEPACTVGEIDLLTNKEKSMFGIYNETAGDYPSSITLNEQFERQVKKTPLKTAVNDKISSLSYEELNRRANQLAHFLQQSGIEADKPVAILMERSVNAIIAVLAVIKAGGACLPISMDYPEKRIEHILKDSNASLVLTDRVHILLQRMNITSLNMQENEWSDYPATNVVSYHTAENLAYIIYTSGTTGNPKGVMQTHRTLMNLMYEQYDHSDIDFSGSIIQFANIGFDVFFQEIFSALLAGGNLCVISDEDKKDIPVLYDFIRVHQAQVLFLPTAYLKYIFSQPAYSAMFPAEIKHIITAGEALIVSDLLKKHICTHSVQLHNHYGPAETHVTTIYTMDQTNVATGAAPIGTPIMNHASYIYNPSMQLQPVGVTGELHIAGHGVARGYLNNRQLTNDKFVCNPSNPGEILYKTGDLARWNEAGIIEYMGRADQQVKIRGYRVEITDIQQQFMKYPGIQEVEIVLEDNSRLYAFFVADSAEMNIQHIKQYISNELPSYMVPSHMMQVEHMPFTLNGKVDRRVLMQNFKNTLTNEAIQQPMTVTEQQLLYIWQDVLKTDHLQLDDNFFEVGGNSLLVLTLLSKIEELYPDQLRVADIFMYPAISRLAAFIDNRSRVSVPQKKVQLSGTALPESYAAQSLSNHSNGSFEYTFEKEHYRMIDQICQKEQINFKLLILCISSFTMHKVFKQNECTMYYGNDQRSFITPLSFDFGSIGNFTDLFRIGQQQLSSTNDSLQLDMNEQETWLSPDKKLVTAVLDDQTVIQFKNITQKMDFVVSFDYEHDTLVVKASYHPGKLQKSQAAELFRHIIHAAAMLINKVKS